MSFKQFKFRIKKLITFIKFGWNDYDWDCDYILELMEYKIRETGQRLVDYDFHVGAKESGLKAIEAADLLKKIREDDYDFEDELLSTRDKDLKKFCAVFEENVFTWWD